MSNKNGGEASRALEMSGTGREASYTRKWYDERGVLKKDIAK